MGANKDVTKDAKKDAIEGAKLSANPSTNPSVNPGAKFNANYTGFSKKAQKCLEQRQPKKLCLLGQGNE